MWLGSALVCLALAVTTAHARPASRAIRHKRRGVWQRYRVDWGESLESIARHLGVSVEDLMRWNRIRGKHVRPGRILKFFGKKLRTESVGKPYRGRLIAGVSIDRDGDGKGVGWIVSKHRRHQIFGTRQTVAYVKKCLARYRYSYSRKRAPPVVVGDLSRRWGGRLRKHRSHQSGRDVDIGYAVKRRDPINPVLVRATRDNLLLPAQWFIVKCFLDNRATQMIFMDGKIVTLLENYIRKKYRRKRHLLRKYLRFFRGPNQVIRRDREHYTHMHVRFKCPRSHRRCMD